MSAAVYQYQWATDPSTQFRGTIAQNAGVDLDLQLPPTLQNVNGTARGSIRSLTISSIQNLAWEVWFWTSTARSTLTGGVTAAGSTYLARWTFATGDAVQKGATGDFEYYIDGLDIPYIDDDKLGQLHITLINRSAAGKSSGDAGAIQIKGRIAQPLY